MAMTIVCRALAGASALLLPICVISPASAFECRNIDDIAAGLEAADSRLTDEFEDIDADVALGMVNATIAPMYVAGDTVALGEKNDGSGAVIFVLSRRGGGYCLTALIPASPEVVNRIAVAVLNTRAEQ